MGALGPCVVREELLRRLSSSERLWTHLLADGRAGSVERVEEECC